MSLHSVTHKVWFCETVRSYGVNLSEVGYQHHSGEGVIVAFGASRDAMP
jgi:hypothetical protein